MEIAIDLDHHLYLIILNMLKQLQYKNEVDACSMNYSGDVSREYLNKIYTPYASFLQFT